MSNFVSLWGSEPQTYLVGHVTMVNTKNGCTRVALYQSTLLYIMYRPSLLFIALDCSRANRSIWVISQERELGLAVLSLPLRSALHASLQDKAISLHMIHFYCIGLYIRFFMEIATHNASRVSIGGIHPTKNDQFELHRAKWSKQWSSVLKRGTLFLG